jgi:hypothetical protein
MLESGTAKRDVSRGTILLLTFRSWSETTATLYPPYGPESIFTGNTSKQSFPDRRQTGSNSVTSGLPVIRPQLAIASGAFTYAADWTPFPSRRAELLQEAFITSLGGAIQSVR